MKSIYLQKDKTTFDLSEYPAEAFAASFGLPGAPQIKFGAQPGKEKKRGGVAPTATAETEAKVEVQADRDVVGSSDDEDEDDEEDDESAEEEEDEDDEEEPKPVSPPPSFIHCGK